MRRSPFAAFSSSLVPQFPRLASFEVTSTDDVTMSVSSPRLSVAFAMFCQDYDPSRPTDLRNMTTGLGGWNADAPPTVELTLALGLWNAGAPGEVRCRLGMRRPGDEVRYVGEGSATVQDAGEMVILPLKFTLTLDRPGTYWAVCEFDGQTTAEVPFTVSAESAPAFRQA